MSAEIDRLLDERAVAIDLLEDVETYLAGLAQSGRNQSAVAVLNRIRGARREGRIPPRRRPGR